MPALPGSDQAWPLYGNGGPAGAQLPGGPSWAQTPAAAPGGYLADEDLAGARSVLKAAALTYVAAALAGLLNLARWIRFLR